MATNDDIKGEVTEERVAAMQAAGRTEATPDTATKDATAGDDAASDTETDSAAQPTPKASDEWSAIKERFTPQQVLEMQRSLDNQKAMAAASHRRNSDAAQLQQRADDTLARAEAALQQTSSMQTAFAQLARTNPELGAQIMATLAQDAPQGGNGLQPAPARNTQEGQELAAIKKQMAELTQNVNGFAYGVNSAAVKSEIYAQAAQIPILQKVDQLGELDLVAQRVMDRIVEQDRESPGTINPLDARSVRAAVKAAIANEAVNEQKRRDFYVKDYRAEKKLRNEKAPASAKGSGASVRAGPSPSTSLSPNATSKERFEQHVKDFAALSKRPSTGTASEIG